MPQLTKVWNFNTGLDGWSTSGVITRITTDGSPDSGCLEGSISGRNSGGNNNGTATWNGTYLDLGITPDMTITSIQFRLRKKATLIGNVTNNYWAITSTLGTLLTTPDALSTIPWTLIDGDIISGLDVSPTDNLNLTLTCSLRTGNDASASATMLWDTFELIIDYELDSTPEITLVRQKVGKGTLVPPVGNYVYPKGTKITLTAIPEDGWVFEKWVITDA